MTAQYSSYVGADLAGGPASPRRRGHPAQPPSLLTTSLNNSAQNLGLGHGLHAQTPLSTTSLSSPFSGPQSHYTASPGGASRGNSPMAVRSATGFSGSYNPQQWGRSGYENTNSFSTAAALQSHQSSIRTTTFAPRLQGPDEPVASPPPPYSPQRNEDFSTNAAAIASPSDTMSPDTDYSSGNTPVSAASAATTMSPGMTGYPCDRRSPMPPNPYHSSSPVVGVSAFPPPPPSGSRMRSSSKNHADRILSAISFKGRGSNSSASPANAIDTLQQHTVQALEPLRIDPTLRPPASRRAASTGALATASSSFRPSNGSPSAPRWEHGMPLPPPPPGPPPASTRSQSLCRPTGTASLTIPLNTAPRTRQPPALGTTLGAIPPTPADWSEDGQQPEWHSRSNTPQGLRVETDGSVQQHAGEDNTMNPVTQAEGPNGSHSRRESSSGMLLRTPAVRNRSAKGIRERRSESRTGKARAIDDTNAELAINTFAAEAQKNDVPLKLSPASGGSLSRRRTSTRMTPRSAKNFRGLDEALQNSNESSSADQSRLFDPSRSTPRLDSRASIEFHKSLTPTPPFSPGRDTFQSQSLHDRSSPFLPREALPTPPLQPQGDRRTSITLGVPSNEAGRPISSLLHTPNPEVAIMPLSPESSTSLIESDGPETSKAFAYRFIERARNFASREAACSSDAERLQLFSQYVVAESRIRRDRYTSTFEEEKVDISILTEGMFEPLPISSPQPELQARESLVQQRPDDSRRSSGTSFSESRSRRASTNATSEPTLTLITSMDKHNQPEPSRWNDYVPCLSPIASMSAVTGRDEMDSRGRAASRWWESQSISSHHADGFKVIERTKRESKYMAEPHDSPAILENEISARTSGSYEGYASTSHAPVYGPNEYPPEKTGWHEQSAMPPPPLHPSTPMSAPYTTDPDRLDISRLVTLPPPYPRHHPAVNNSHPELAEIRAVVRSLSDLDEVTEKHAAYESLLKDKRQRADSWCKHQRSLHAQDMQYRLENNTISQEEFDAAETTLEAKEAASAQDLTQATFDLFQTTVVTPVHALYTTLIARATTAFQTLSTRLSTDAASPSPNSPQVEGDEQPELLEKLTQLKWLFEARESLHRDSYNLLSARNAKYKQVVLRPYARSANHDKLADATAFFDRDARARHLAHETAALARWHAFRAVIESHVTRGVETQISAFWDIAPSLQSVLQQVPGPDRLHAFDVLVPRSEIVENPVYVEHPLRYLYSLVLHAEASSRQFIESQVSLWCLLQEVREGVCAVRWRVEDAGGEGRGDGDGEGREGVKRGLVEELKERVAVGEAQWVEGLGGEIGRVKEGVRAWLRASGGWDEELEVGV